MPSLPRSPTRERDVPVAESGPRGGGVVDVALVFEVVVTAWFVDGEGKARDGVFTLVPDARGEAGDGLVDEFVVVVVPFVGTAVAESFAAASREVQDVYRGRDKAVLSLFKAMRMAMKVSML